MFCIWTHQYRIPSFINSSTTSGPRLLIMSNAQSGKTSTLFEVILIGKSYHIAGTVSGYQLARVPWTLANLLPLYRWHVVHNLLTFIHMPEGHVVIPAAPVRCEFCLGKQMSRDRFFFLYAAQFNHWPCLEMLSMEINLQLENSIYNNNCFLFFTAWNRSRLPVATHTGWKSHRFGSSGRWFETDVLHCSRIHQLAGDPSTHL